MPMKFDDVRVSQMLWMTDLLGHPFCVKVEEVNRRNKSVVVSCRDTKWTLYAYFGVPATLSFDDADYFVDLYREKEDAE